MRTGSDESTSPDQDAGHLRRAFLVSAGFAGLLWLVRIADSLFELGLSRFALYPGEWIGLRGVLFAPLLHGGFAHLIANTAPIVALGTALLYGYPRAARVVIPVVWLGSGIAVWLFARPAFHLGASGLTFGMLFFVFTVGVLRWDRKAIAISLAVFLLYGGMIWGVLPTDPRISFEYHLSGSVLGVLLAFLLKDLDPRPPEKTYSWEGEDAEDDDWPFEIPPAGDPSERPRSRHIRVPCFRPTSICSSIRTARSGKQWAEWPATHG
jgi:membrane associated rhomboid family serine protease